MKLKMAYSEGSVEVDELKPCPFCGSTEYLNITSKGAFSELYCENGLATISINCRQCDVDLYEHSYNGPEYDEKVRLMVEKWNRRAKEGIE